MNLIRLLFFYNSRKSGFGLWLFIVANAFLIMKLISADQWFLVITLCSGLLGAGTIADKYLENKKAEKPAQDATK